MTKVRGDRLMSTKTLFAVHEKKKTKPESAPLEHLTIILPTVTILRLDWNFHGTCISGCGKGEFNSLKRCCCLTYLSSQSKQNLAG